jgi:chromosomal replication initiation ATPase DnaA
MSVDRDRLLSSSRERRLTLTRAIIGWHVTQNRIATLTEVSRALGRDPSSVYTAYERYRARRPKLFRDSLETILGYLTNDDPGQLLGSADRRKH